MAATIFTATASGGFGINQRQCSGNVVVMA
jgi:hypothetical protein